MAGGLTMDDDIFDVVSVSVYFFFLPKRMAEDSTNKKVVPTVFTRVSRVYPLVSCLTWLLLRPRPESVTCEVARKRVAGL